MTCGYENTAFQAEVVMQSFLRRSMTCGYENTAFQAVTLDTSITVSISELLTWHKLNCRIFVPHHLCPERTDFHNRRSATCGYSNNGLSA
jgi:hypothetical protein